MMQQKAPSFLLQCVFVTGLRELSKKTYTEAKKIQKILLYTLTFTYLITLLILTVILVNIAGNT